MDALIFNTLRRVQSCEDETERQRLMDESNEELAAHFSRNQADLQELAYDVLNLMWSDAVNDSLLRRVIDVKTVGLNEVDYIEEDLRGMRAYFQGKGGQIRSDILRSERSTMPREEIVTAIDMHQDQISANFWGSLGKLQAQARDKMRFAPLEYLIQLVQAAITGGATFGSFAKATLSDSQVDPIVDQVALRSGGQAVIAGTSVAVRALSNIGLDYGDNIAEQIFRTGVIGVYKGRPVVQVENSEDFAGNFVLPNDELWVIGRNAGRLTYYGAAAKVQTLPLHSFWIRWETARDAGLSVYGAAKGRLGRIVLT